jgi:hypothetical protein
MQKIKFEHKLIFSHRAKKMHEKKIKRKQKKHKRKIGWYKYLLDIKKNAEKNSRVVTYPKFNIIKNQSFPIKKPEFSTTIKYLSAKVESLSAVKNIYISDGIFEIPSIFSLTENYSESFSFLKKLFYALYNQSNTNIKLDYINCKRIDLDASVLMDIMLGEFILHFKECQSRKYPVKIKDIKPINYEDEHIKKILFSIGAFSSINGFQVKYDDIIPYTLRFGINKHPNASKIREVHITEMVDYVLKCTTKMGRILTAEAEANLFTIIGEVLINAEDHSSGDKSFSIGYFQDKEENGEHVGVFHLVVLNFGKTIYEMFSDPNCPNISVVEEMKSLSKEYTRKGFFSKAKFEEQCLWTLYALQEGVTSKADWKRGNGSIRFIDSFFNLKGDNKKDDMSYLSIISGNTRIIFDGTYRLFEKVKGKHGDKFKMMTFNETGDITIAPDKNYVTFVDNYFPGTIISAKICLKEFNTEESI